MFPLPDGQVYPRNNWYVAAQSKDVGRTPFERKILNKPVVLYRKIDGTPVALAGLCPHRLSSLAKGKLVGDQIECGYHGLTFDACGKCTQIPTQSQIPDRFVTQAYPLVERGFWIWIWVGPPELADPSLLPDLSAIGIETPGWRADDAGYHYLKARYTLLIDNLMDLSHIAFIHSKSVPGGRFLLSSDGEAEEHANVFRFKRHYAGIPMDDVSKMLHPDLDGPIDSGLISEYMGPCLINAGGPYVSKPKETYNVRKMNFIHAMTPETPNTTHYFVAISRNFRIDDDKLSEVMSDMAIRVSAEDVMELDRIETYVNQYADPKKELSFMADAGAIRVRRMLSAQIAKEQAAG